MNFETLIKKVPDFPKKGILFYDLTPIFANPQEFTEMVVMLRNLINDSGIEFDRIAAIEARGFILGSVLALELEVGFIPIRKYGKLPREVKRLAHETEYSQDCHEVHAEDLGAEDNVLIVDDILATGHTAFAAAELVKECGAKVAGFAFAARIKGLMKEPIAEEDKIVCLMELG